MKTKDCIFFQLSKASRNANQLWKKKLQDIELTGVQGMILNFLAEKDDIASHTLGKATNLDSATITGVLDRLEKMSLILRKPATNDRRTISIQLTEKGKELSKLSYQLKDEANNEFQKKFSKEEMMMLKGLLCRI